MTEQLKNRIKELKENAENDMNSIVLDTIHSKTHISINNLRKIYTKIHLQGITEGLAKALEIIDEEESEEQK